MNKINIRPLKNLVTSTVFDTALFAVIAAVLLVVLVQVLYPVGTTMPFARIAGTPVGGRSADEVIEELRRTYGSRPLTVGIPNADPVRTTTVKAGITPRYRQAVAAASDYSLAERLVPFSLAVKSIKAADVELPYAVENDRYTLFEQEVQAACLKKSQDASLGFENGSVQLKEAREGQRCQGAAIRSALTSLRLTPGKTEVSVAPEPLPPARTTGDVRRKFEAAQQTITNGLVVASEGERWQVAPEIIAGWLTVDETDGRYELDVKPEAVRAYLDGIRGKLYITPGITEIRTLDGREISRTVGTNGRGVDTDVTTERIRAALLGRETARVAWVQLRVLPPEQKVIRSYTSSYAGMQALVEQWDRDYPARYGVVVRDLSGRGLSASLHADRDFVTASTFKMFLAYAVLHKVETGELSLDAATDTGLSVRACIDEMIVNSTNECALSLFRQVGWDYAHTFIKSQFPATSLKNSASRDNEKHTTPQDEADFMTRLYTGELMNKANTDYLLGLMKRQVWRGGIPKGVPGVTVADKVGFYNGYKHDTAIVYGPKGPYVLTVLTYGGNDAQIAELSRRVYALMNQ